MRRSQLARRRSISTSTPQATSRRRVRGAHEIKHVAIAL
jgi:hypothetical protein